MEASGEKASEGILDYVAGQPENVQPQVDEDNEAKKAPSVREDDVVVAPLGTTGSYTSKISEIDPRLIMVSNPESLEMDSEGMKNLRPEDWGTAAEQLNHRCPEEMVEIGKEMANASPEELVAMHACLDALDTFEINAAQMLKEQGNELHSQGRYNDALQKYLLAKNNLKGVPASKGRTLLCACSLNLMSCYLKIGQYDNCIKEGTEVLARDAKNIKALYRRGQAYKALGQFGSAVSDLTTAHEVSPNDKTIADVLSDAKENLMKVDGGQKSRESHQRSPTESFVSKPQERSGHSQNQPDILGVLPSTSSEYLQSTKDDLEFIRSFQNLISHIDPEILAAMGNEQAEDTSPDMIRIAMNVISKMSTEKLQRMIELASCFQGDNSSLNRGSFNSNGNSFNPESISTNLTPDMLKMATKIMCKMSPEEIQQMFDMEFTLKGVDGASSSAAVNSSRNRSNSKSITRDIQNSNRKVRDNDAGESSTSQLFSSSRTASQSSIPSSSADPQEEMRNQMEDPAMRQVFLSLIKNINPDMMENMSKQFELEPSWEDDGEGQQAMPFFSLEDLDRIMRWASRLLRVLDGAMKTKNWLQERPGMVLAIVMLPLAIFLHWLLGYVGR